MRGQRSIVPAAVACALALVAGCGQPGIGQAPDAGQRVKLVYFNARGAEPSERKLIERYQRDHPDIQIEYQASTAMSAPSDTDAISNLIFNVQAGIEVDVSKVEVTRTPLALLPAHAAIELTSIGGQAVTDRLDQLLNNNLAQVKGGIWSLPYEYDPFGYVYNADMFKAAGLNPDQPPKTWDELRTAARALKSTYPDTSGQSATRSTICPRFSRTSGAPGAPSSTRTCSRRRPTSSIQACAPPTPSCASGRRTTG